MKNLAATIIEIKLKHKEQKEALRVKIKILKSLCKDLKAECRELKKEHKKLLKAQAKGGQKVKNSKKVQKSKLHSISEEVKKDVVDVASKNMVEKKKLFK